MIKKIFISLFVLIINVQESSAQNEYPSHLQISVITCSPGNELYSIFGHTALRIIDSTTGYDIIYNYGTFNFDDPDFLVKFIRGKLDYYLSAEDGGLFFQYYLEEGRSITEQVLELTDSEKINIRNVLTRNLSGSNKFYKYDFLFNNCTTKIRALLQTHTEFVCNKPLVKQGTSFRNILYQYLQATDLSWSKLGIDLLLGSKVDKPVTIRQSTFLPDYLMMAIDSFNVEKKIISERKVYQTTQKTSTSKINQPLVLFICLLAITLFFIFL